MASTIVPVIPLSAETESDQDEEDEIQQDNDADDKEFEGDPQAANPEDKQYLNFPRLLFDFLCKEEDSDVIDWVQNGKAFAVLNKKRFEKEVMPKFLGKKSQYRSFLKRLNRWEFVRLRAGRGFPNGAYQNKNFQQGRPDMLKLMKFTNDSHIGRQRKRNEESKEVHTKSRNNSSISLSLQNPPLNASANLQLPVPYFCYPPQPSMVIYSMPYQQHPQMLGGGGSPCGQPFLGIPQSNQQQPQSWITAGGVRVSSGQPQQMDHRSGVGIISGAPSQHTLNGSNGLGIVSMGPPPHQHMISGGGVRVVSTVHPQNIIGNGISATGQTHPGTGLGTSAHPQPTFIGNGFVSLAPSHSMAPSVMTSPGQIIPQQYAFALPIMPVQAQLTNQPTPQTMFTVSHPAGMTVQTINQYNGHYMPTNGPFYVGGLPANTIFPHT